MMFISWSDDYLTGYPEIDSDHKHMLSMINGIYSAAQSGYGQSHIGQMLKQLAAYTREHFEREENLMIQHRYERYTAHKLEHSLLINELNSAIDNFENGSLGIDIDTMEFFKAWILHHTMGVDLDLGNFLKESLRQEPSPRPSPAERERESPGSV